MAYYAKKQEVFFQPCRIRILADGSQSYLSSKNYYIVLQNMITGQIVEWWNPKDGYSITGEWGKKQGRRIHHKKDAVPTAKLEAQERGLAFDPKIDIVDYKEVVEGPRRFCLLCEKQLPKRGYELAACKSCKADIVTGQHARAGREQYLIALGGLLASPYIRVAEPTSRRLATLMLQVAGVQAGPRWERYGPRAITVADTIGNSSKNEYDNFVVSLTAPQAEAMQAIDELVTEFGQAWRRDGIKDGSNLLKRLVSGEMHPHDFAAKREGIK